MDSLEILQTLAAMYPALSELDTWCLYGASAMILSGIDIGSTSDIDILTTAEGTEVLKKRWQAYLESCPLTKEDYLFRSNFARFRFPLMDVEVAGDLEVCKEGAWQPVTIPKSKEICMDGMKVRIVTMEEQTRLLRLFGREKDMQRLKLILLPKDKHDVSHIEQLHRLTDEEIAPLIPDLLEWVQDINWPVALPVVDVLKEREELVFPPVVEIMKGDDEMWQYWIREYLVPSLSPEHQQAIRKITE